MKPNIELNLNWKQMSLDLVSLNETQGVLAVPQPGMRSISNIRALVILLRLNSMPCHEVSKDTLSSEYLCEAALDGWDSVKCVSPFLDKRHQISEHESTGCWDINVIFPKLNWHNLQTFSPVGRRSLKTAESFRHAPRAFIKLPSNKQQEKSRDTKPYG